MEKEQSIEEQSIEGQNLCVIGDYYRINNNYEKAKEYYLIAVYLNNSNAMHCLGYCYYAKKNIQRQLNII